MFRPQFTDVKIMDVADVESDLLIFIVVRARDQIIGRCKAQSIARMEHCEVLEMSICVAHQKARKNTAKQAVCFRRDACRRIQNEPPHVLISPFIFFSRVFSQQLIEFFKVQTPPRRRPIKALDNESILFNDGKVLQCHFYNFIVWQEGPDSQRRQIFECEHFLMIPGRKLGNVRAQLPRPDWPELCANPDQEQLSLNARQGGSASHGCRRCLVSLIGRAMLQRFRVLNGYGASQIAAKAKKQCKSVGWIDAQDTGLGIPKPPFCNQIVEERVQAPLIDVRFRLKWQRVGNCRSVFIKPCGIVSKDAATAGFFLQPAGVDLV